MRNPFTFGGVVSGHNFADRRREIDELARALAGGTNVIISSPRRYGKTSLVLEVFRRLEAQGVLTIYVDLFPATSQARLVEIYAGAISRASKGKLEEAIGFLREIIPTPKIVIRPEGVPGVEVELGRTPKEVDTLLGAILEAPQKLAKRKKRRVSVAFDEFQEIENLDGEQIQREIRTRIQHHDRVAYVFAGSRRHLLGRLFEDKTRPLYRIGKPFELGPIPAQDFKEFITGKFKSSGIMIAGATVEEILSFTDCHPYHTQQLCHEIWNLAGPSSQVRQQHVQQAIEIVLASQNYAFTTIWETLPPSQRALLRGIALDGGREIYSKDFIAKHSLGTPSNIQKASRALTERGLLERSDAEYVITDVFQREWLRRI